jgi:hypothetical protein
MIHGNRTYPQAKKGVSTGGGHHERETLRARSICSGLWKRARGDRDAEDRLTLRISPEIDLVKTGDLQEDVTAM